MADKLLAMHMALRTNNGFEYRAARRVHIYIIAVVLVSVIAQAGTGFIQLEPRELVVLEGGVAIFTCSPLYTVALPILVRNGAVMVHREHPRLTFTDHGIDTADGYRTYTLGNVTRNENGSRFECVLGGFLSNTITMTVFIAPKVTGPSEITILEYHPHRSILQYNISGVPHPQNVAWQHNGSPFTGNPRVLILNPGSNSTVLSVQAPLRDDAGCYTITVSSSVGNASLTVKLTIVYNEFIESPGNVTAMSGSQVTMKCAHRFGWAYAWFSNKNSLYRNTDKVFVSGSGKTLTYGPVDYTDHQLQIFCVVHLKGNSHLFVSRLGNLTVLSSPVIHTPSMVNAIKGFPIIIPFTVNGYPPSSSIAYSHNNQPIKPEEDNMYSLGNDRTSLVIANVSKSDAGSYTIRASNELGGATNTAQLEIEYSPEIIPLLEAVVGQIHKSVNFPCGKSVSGNPEPQLSWYREPFPDTSLLSDDRFTIDQQTGELSLSVTEYTDAGQFVCIARNLHGRFLTYVTLLVLDPPSSPLNVEVLLIGSTWFSARWSPPQLQGSRLISAYKVRATPTPNSLSDPDVTAASWSHQDSAVSSQHLPPSTGTSDSGYSRDSACVETACDVVEMTVRDTSGNLSGLVPAVKYLIQVIALSNGTNLASEPSGVVCLKTNVSAPGIGSVNATVLGPAACILHWTLKFSGGFPVQLFEIQFQRVNNSYWRDVLEPAINPAHDQSSSTVFVPGDQRYSIINGLESTEEYHFRVRGTNEFGRGQFTTTIAPLTSHTVGVPSQPMQPAVVSWTTDSVTLNSSVTKTGNGNTLNVTGMLILNGVKVSTQTEAIVNVPPGVEFRFKYNNVSYRGDWQFQVVAANHLGFSKPSRPSLFAKDYNREITIVFASAGPFVGGIVGGVNFVVMVIMLFMCSTMFRELLRRKKSMARRVEMAQANDCPVSPRPTLSADYRNSPVDRRNPHIALPDPIGGNHHEMRPDIQLFSRLVVTPSTPMSSVSMV